MERDMMNYRIIRVTGDSPAHVHSERGALPGLTLFGLHIESVTLAEIVHQEGGVWCQRVLCEGAIA